MKRAQSQRSDGLTEIRGQNIVYRKVGRIGFANAWNECPLLTAGANVRAEVVDEGELLLGLGGDSSNTSFRGSFNELRIDDDMLTEGATRSLPRVREPRDIEYFECLQMCAEPPQFPLLKVCLVGLLVHPRKLTPTAISGTVRALLLHRTSHRAIRR